MGVRYAAGHYFVATPLQLLNAREAVYSMQQLSEHHLYVLVKSLSRKSEILKLVVHSEWTSVSIIDAAKFNSSKVAGFFDFPGILAHFKKVIANIQPGSSVFVGNFNEIFFQYVLRRLEQRTTQYLLDDGFASVNIHTQQRVAGITLRKPITLFNHFLKYLLGIADYKLNANIVFFTVFELEQGSTVHGVVKNSFARLRSEMISTVSLQEKTVAFIGQPLVANGYLTPAQYNIQILGLRSYYESKGFCFVYLLHPAEHRDDLPTELEKVATEGALEIHMLQQASVPRVFATCFSSACLNLNILLGSRHEFHYWKLDHMPGNINNNMVYDYISKMSASEVKLYNYADVIKGDYVRAEL
jgi:hypothetical protein